MRYSLLALLVAVTAGDARAVPPIPPTPFDAKLYGQLARRDGNLVASPDAIAYAFALVRDGAKGATATEIDDALVPGTSAAAGRHLQAPSSSKPAPGVTLELATRLYADAAIPIATGFAAEPATFHDHAEDARAAINQWVAGATHGRIKDLLAPKAVTAQTRLAVVSAMSVTAAWQTPFLTGATRPATFRVAAGKSKPVPTMHAVAAARWGEHDGAKVLDLPFATVPGAIHYSMLIIVPDPAKLAAVEASCAKAGFERYLAAASTVGPVDVALPSFEVGTTVDLVPVMTALGVKRAFSDHAELAGLSTAPARLSTMVHRSWLRVDENGLVAATPAVAPPADTSPPHAFAVDRAFLFVVHDDSHNVLFVGRIVDPTR